MSTGSRAVAWDFDGEFLIRLAPAVTCQLRLPGGFLRPLPLGEGQPADSSLPPGNFPLNLAYRPPSADSPSAHPRVRRTAPLSCCTCR